MMTLTFNKNFIAQFANSETCLIETIEFKEGTNLQIQHFNYHPHIFDLFLENNSALLNLTDDFWEFATCHIDLHDLQKIYE